jgi:hypothetical protein
MTQPDKWDEIAFGFVKKARTFPVFQDELAQALRDAEKAGMEKAAEIIGQFRTGEIARNGGPMKEWNTTYSKRLQRLIRTAKETEE